MVTKVSRWQLETLLLFMFAATDSNGGKGRLTARLAKEKASNAAGALLATSSSPCVDDSFWSNVNGHPCAEYAQHPQWCIEAEKFPNASGTPASIACPVACMTGCGAESADVSVETDRDTPRERASSSCRGGSVRSYRYPEARHTSTHRISRNGISRTYREPGERRRGRPQEPKQDRWAQ